MRNCGMKGQSCYGESCCSLTAGSHGGQWWRRPGRAFFRQEWLVIVIVMDLGLGIAAAAEGVGISGPRSHS